MSEDILHQDKDAKPILSNVDSTEMGDDKSKDNISFREKVLVPTIFPDNDDVPLNGSDLTTLKSFLQTTVTHLCPRLGIFSHVKWFSFVRKNVLLDANIAALVYWESINPKNLYPKTVPDLLNSYPVSNYKNKLADIFQKPEKVIRQWFSDKTAGRPLKATFEVIDELGEAARKQKEYLDKIIEIQNVQKQILREHEESIKKIRFEDINEIIFYVEKISKLRDPQPIISEVVGKLEIIQRELGDSISISSDKINKSNEGLISKLEEDLQNKIDDLERFFSVIKTIGKRQRKAKMKIEKEKGDSESPCCDDIHSCIDGEDEDEKNDGIVVQLEDSENIADEPLAKIKEEWKKQREKLSGSTEGDDHFFEEDQSGLLSLEEQVKKVVRIIENPQGSTKKKT